MFFDPFLGRNKNQNIKIAVAYVDDEEFKIIEIIDGVKSVKTLNVIFDYTLMDE